MTHCSLDFQCESSGSSKEVYQQQQYGSGGRGNAVRNRGSGSGGERVEVSRADEGRSLFPCLHGASMFVLGELLVAAGWGAIRNGS